MKVKGRQLIRIFSYDKGSYDYIPALDSGIGEWEVRLRERYVDFGKARIDVPSIIGSSCGVFVFQEVIDAESRDISTSFFFITDTKLFHFSENEFQILGGRVFSGRKDCRIEEIPLQENFTFSTLKL